MGKSGNGEFVGYIKLYSSISYPFSCHVGIGKENPTIMDTSIMDPAIIDIVSIRSDSFV